MTNNEKTVLYAVMKLGTKVLSIDPATGAEVQLTLGGCAGYIPVFATAAEAEENTFGGKYQILELQIPDND